jgi:uncharacterized membrane protein YhaH (DUF805 family)
MKWMVLPLRRYADFRGRSCRREYWMFMLLYMAVWFGVTPILIGLQALEGRHGVQVVSIVGGLLMAAWWLGTVVPWAAVSVRRLHDRDLPGWLYLVFLGGWFVPGVGLFTFIAYFVLMVLEGQPGENQYGPDPMGRSLEEIFA